jgi:type IV secretory pathway VirD2 relaxase
MTTHETPDAALEAQEAALIAALARRAKLVGMRARIASETADNEFTIVEAKAKVKALKKYLHERGKWVTDRMRAQPHLSYEALIEEYPLPSPE